MHIFTVTFHLFIFCSLPAVVRRHNADRFENEFRKAMQVNDSISWVPDHEIQTEIAVKQEDIYNAVVNVAKDINEEQYLGWTEEEKRKHLVKRAQEAGKLFAGSNDNSDNRVTTWKMPNKESVNPFANYDFEKQRGFDL
eukprot:761044_1